MGFITEDVKQACTVNIEEMRMQHEREQVKLICLYIILTLIHFDIQLLC